MKKETTLEEWQLLDAEELRRLFKARTERGPNGKLISQMEFGAKYGIGSQGMVWQYLHGRRPLNIKAAVGFARGLGVRVHDFSESLASQIEDASEVDQGPARVSLVTTDEQRHLQWITNEEAALLDRFRSCAQLEKAQALVFLDSLPKLPALPDDVRNKA